LTSTSRDAPAPRILPIRFAIRFGSKVRRRLAHSVQPRLRWERTLSQQMSDDRLHALEGNT
jgi:hypothetical protein